MFESVLKMRVDKPASAATDAEKKAAIYYHFVMLPQVSKYVELMLYESLVGHRHSLT